MRLRYLLHLHNLIDKTPACTRQQLQRKSEQYAPSRSLTAARSAFGGVSFTLHPVLHLQEGRAPFQAMQAAALLAKACYRYTSG